MKVPHRFDKCIVCHQKPVGDWEHIMPESIGGRLQARILCNRCNHGFGQKLVATVKTDPSVRLALQSLKKEIPGLYSKFQNKAAFVGRADDGSIIRASSRKGRIRILASQGSGGSIIQDTSEATKTLERVLKRRGTTQEEISSFQSSFAKMEEDAALTLPTGHTFVKRGTARMQPDLRGKFIDNRLPALIAFEFWSLCIGRRIYDGIFDPMREYIQHGTKTRLLTVEHLGARSGYDTFHAIAMEPAAGAIRTKIRLFGWIVFVVTFHGFDYRGPDSVYFEDLKAAKPFIALTRQDARQGKWITD